MTRSRRVFGELSAAEPLRVRLVTIKAVHSAVFVAELAAIGWLVASGLLGRRDRSVALAAALVGAESAVFVANRGVCPLTPLAERYGAVDGRVSDIFLPQVVARTIPAWAASLVALASALHVRAFIRARRSGGQSEGPRWCFATNAAT
ncbi:MAG TPA: hypothetical protein VFI28_01860 [Candidatus Limnocylindrales bacterium]|nr:hypothetical protein [Candidatus Limnocylindrales bacterium]